MKEFSIPLIKKYSRPLIEIFNVPALIDTSSVIPIVSMYPSMFEKVFDAKKILSDEFLYNERGAVYSFAEFKIGELIFKEFEIFVPDTPKFQFPFVLSATLFHGMTYEIDTINQKFTVRMKDEQSLEREFKIKKFRGELYPQIDGVLFQDVDIELQDCQIFF